jgi:formylglycine-generating enzyme required for sulfatase activity
MPDVSPTTGHAAHTTWFFETFLLERFEPKFEPHHEAFRVLFNSYYNCVGEQFSRAHRGTLSRPTLAECTEYRAAVDARIDRLIERCPMDDLSVLFSLVEVGLHHEQQHQELLLTDILHVFSVNPLEPAYIDASPAASSAASQAASSAALSAAPSAASPAAPSAAPTPRSPGQWVPFAGGMRSIGHEGNGFCFDNELPRHEAFIRPFELGSRAVNCAEWITFMNDGGYERPELWHSAGWAEVCENKWSAPLYWKPVEGEWTGLTLNGRRPVSPNAPVTHVSWFEASAYASWAGGRLPSEQEWELASRGVSVNGNFLGSGALHPVPGAAEPGESTLTGMFGDTWEWTASSYDPYPGYRAPEGAIGEYNGKFMCSQYVLRGGSCVTSQSHVRPTYRNFFPPDARWQFSGVRIARDA